jgi:hypothetical protein
MQCMDMICDKTGFFLFQVFSFFLFNIYSKLNNTISIGLVDHHIQMKGRLSMVARYFIVSLCSLLILLGCSKDDASPIGSTTPTPTSYEFTPQILFHGAIPDPTDPYGHATTTLANSMNAAIATETAMFFVLPVTKTSAFWSCSVSVAGLITTYNIWKDTTGYSWQVTRNSGTIETIMSGKTTLNCKSGYWDAFDAGKHVGKVTFNTSAGDTLTGSIVSYDSFENRETEMDITNYPDKSGGIENYDYSNAAPLRQKWMWGASGSGFWWDFVGTTTSGSW